MIVGIDDQTAEISAVMTDHPELGFEAVGVVGSVDEAERADLAELWVGELDQLMKVVRAAAVTGAIVSSTAVDPPRSTTSPAPSSSSAATST